MPDTNFLPRSSLDPAKFRDPDVTAKGEPRASVPLSRLRTVWFNTGSLCNIACDNCYIESSPRNDRLAYLTAEDVRGYLDEIEREHLGVEEIGFTGGEPFMNGDLPRMLADTLGRGYRVLVLTNAMKPMQRHAQRLLAFAAHGPALIMRVSLDHYDREAHERVRGPGTWAPALAGLRWLFEHGFSVAVASRTFWPEREDELRDGFARLFAAEGFGVDAWNPAQLVLFPEMNAKADVPEITVACWGILGVDPGDMMCATSRMVIKRKEARAPVVVPCTLLPYDPTFELGRTLVEAAQPVKLNHPFCAQFCVLGGASCSAS
ncbi:MAG: radical SAM protein [Rhodospirillales bacterium]|nr:radical SAM protein [Rhodospirillales bacterium]